MNSMSHRAGVSRGVGLVIGVLGFLVLAFAPLGGPETLAARRMAAVAFLMASWWVSEAIPLAATGLLPIVLFPALGILGAGETCAEYGHHLIMLFLSGFLLARALSRWRLDVRLALAVVAVVGDRPRLIVLAMMAVTAFLSMWVSNSATAAMMMPVGLAVVDHAAGQLSGEECKVDSRPGHFHFGVAVMLGIAYAASIGGVGTLVGTPPNVLLAGMLEQLAGVKISFAAWMLVGIPVVVTVLPAVWVWLVFFAHPPEVRRLPGGRELVTRRLAALGRVGRGGWLTAVVVVLTALAWITRPLWQVLFPEPTYLKDATVGIVGALALFLLPSFEKEGGKLLDGASLMEVPWRVLLLFGGGLALAKGFVATGLSRLLGEGIVGFAKVPAPLFVFLIALAVVSLTEFASNTASTAMILPLLAATAASLGLSAPLLMIPAALAASMAFMMPASTPPNAIVFGTGYVRLPTMIRAGLGANVIALVVIVVVSLLIVAPVWG